MPIEENLLQLGAQNALLRDCASSTLETIARRGSLCSCPAGAKVLGEGDTAAYAFLPLQGRFQVSKTAATGRRQVFCTMEPGFCGNLCMFFMTERSLADIHATEPSRLVMIPVQEAIDLTLADPVVGREAWSSLARCLGHLAGMVENLSFHKVSERVARDLLGVAEADGTTIRCTQAELAAQVGTTREVVARCLAEFQESGAIRLGRGRIVVLSRDRLLPQA
jgi:CRP/FNR family transcriptional regulator